MRINISTTVIVLFTLAISSFFQVAKAQQSAASDTVVMSPGYANEVYYSMADGSVLSSMRNQWDIAFRTNVMSSGILTNDGTGVVLYTYPKADTAGWSSVDTVGLSSWTRMFNDPNDWENGAFSRNATVHPDYGWGIYNSVTHDLTADSIYVIKLRNGNFKKIWIVKKFSAASTFLFRYANLDGTDPQEVQLNLSGDGAYDYVGYSLQTNEKIMFEAPKADWDIVFTKYMSVQPDGSPYPVTGVLSNDGVKVKNFEPVPLTYSDWGVGTWDSTRSAIGWNWKVLNASYTYDIVDSSVYFIRAKSGDIYKLYFTSFAGSSTGKISFMKEKVAGVGISDNFSDAMNVSVYPNPAKNRINTYITGKSGEVFTVVLTDLSGRQLRADRPGRLADGLNVYAIDVAGVQPGVYFVTVSAAAMKSVTKVIIVN
jgi:hypothetical protein